MPPARDQPEYHHAGAGRHDKARTPGLAEAWLKFRDRLLASPKFQSLAAKFFLTRPIARREARALFDICAGFVYAQTLAACVELDLFEFLAPGPAAIEILASRAGMPAPAMRMLLDAAVSLRLLATAGVKYRLGSLGAALRGNPGIAAMVAHHRLFYNDLAQPVSLLRGETKTALSQFWPYLGGTGEAEKYSALMSATQPMIAGEILAAYGFAKHRCVLDIGGGDGSFLTALAARAPKLQLRLFDLPDVTAQAMQKFAAAGLSHRADARGGDVFADALPEGADIITLVRVLHDHDDHRAVQLLRAARRALPMGGTLLIAEPMAGARGASPIGAAYFGFYLFAMGSGRARTPAEIDFLVQQAGFAPGRVVPTNQPMLASMIIARAAHV